MSKRKKYRPRPVNPLAHLVAMQGVALLDIRDKLQWTLDVTDAINAVATGTATKASWQTIFEAINTVDQIVIDKMATDDGNIVHSAQEACVAILDRRRLERSTAVRATELAALRKLASEFSEIMDALTQSEMALIQARIQQRFNRVLNTPESRDRVILVDD